MNNTNDEHEVKKKKNDDDDGEGCVVGTDQTSLWCVLFFMHYNSALCSSLPSNGICAASLCPSFSSRWAILGVVGLEKVGVAPAFPSRLLEASGCSDKERGLDTLVRSVLVAAVFCAFCCGLMLSS
mmetsp:Transcript_23260/g.37713  ORF Transcript_23260/g.37713 Transcript_23260/m.37713 type:complete len:126 (+) Transcript_23260:959-1336(+)